MSPLFQIVYTSTSSRKLSRLELTELLHGSVQRNKESGVTGMLLFKDGAFMQVLEGEMKVVSGLFAKICRDRRHHNIIPLIQEPIHQRNFPSSAMAFRDLKTDELRELPGYSEFLNTPLNAGSLKQDIPKCQRLLLYFKKNIR